MEVVKEEVEEEEEEEEVDVEKVECLSYQHLQKAGLLDDEAWIDTLGRVGSLRYRALKKSRWVKEYLTNTAGPSLNSTRTLAGSVLRLFKNSKI